MFASSTCGVAEEKRDGSGSFLRAVRDHAKALAQQPHRPPNPGGLPDALQKLNYDQYHEIGVRFERAPWARDDLPFRVQLLHRGYLFRDAVQIHSIEQGTTRRIEFSPAMFTYGSLRLPVQELKDLDFAGFRVMWRGRENDYPEVASFVGASYFRFIGRGHHYGSSARGLAIDTGEARVEEFPRFTQFWLQKPGPGERDLTLYALLDSPSATGAFRFDLAPGAETSVTADATLFARTKDKKFGIAPLTSMFLMGESRTRWIPDFRPEVHDCDGLLVQHANGSREWRPVTNPERKHQITRIPVSQLAGFGLMQRDRSYSSYVDLQAEYEKRPGYWVAPSGDWGKGHVELVEIPTTTEYNDNIVAYWVPDSGLAPGKESRFQYTITAMNQGPTAGELFEVESTRITPEHEGKLPRFVVDFRPPDGKSHKAERLEGKVTTSVGEVRHLVTQTNSAAGGWRLFFDYSGPKDKRAELKAALTRGGAVVSETWQYHLHEP